MAQSRLHQCPLTLSAKLPSKSPGLRRRPVLHPLPPSCWTRGVKRLVSASWDGGLFPGRVTLLGPEPLSMCPTKKQSPVPSPQGLRSHLQLLPHPRFLPSSVWFMVSQQPEMPTSTRAVHARHSVLSAYEHTAWGWRATGSKGKDRPQLAGWLSPGRWPVIQLTAPPPPGTQPCAGQGGVDMEQPSFQAALPGPGVSLRSRALASCLLSSPPPRPVSPKIVH